MQNNKNQVAASPAAGAAGAGPANQQAPRRVVFLNALPLNALPRAHLELDVHPVELDELARWVQRRVAEGCEVIHFIRHPSTIQLLRSLGVPLSETPNSGLYSYQHGDLLVVVSLRSPVRGQEAAQLSPQDLEAWVVTVL